MGNKSSARAQGKRPPYVLREINRMILNNEPSCEWETSKIVRDKKTGSVEVIRMKKQ